VKTRAATITLLSSAALLLAQPSVRSFAQPAKAPTAGDKADPAATARSRFNEGVAFAKREQWPRAYSAFLEAWKLKEHPQIALNLGRAEMELGKHRDAFAHLRYVLDHGEPGSPDMKLAREWLTEVEKKVGRLAITVDAAGAEVLVDGVSQGTSPLAGAVIVDPGKHEIEIRRPSGSETRIVEVAGGGTAEVKLEAAKKSPDDTGQPPPPTPTVVVVESPRAWRTPVLITGGVLSAAGLALGGAFLGISLDRGAALTAAALDKNGRDAMLQAANDEALARNGMLWSFVGAGVALAGTAAVFFLVKPSPGPSVQGKVGFGTGGPTVSVQGSF
jgi:hypothetical protein